MDYNNNNYNEGVNTYDSTYTTYEDAVAPEKNTIGMVGMILGILGFFFNPLYLVSVAAIILSIIGVCKKNAPKGLAIAGIILGGISMACQGIVDFLLTIFTGIGIISIFC